MEKPFQLLRGDSLHVLRELPDNSVDSIVTDPPYGISFMNRRWDYDVPATALWAEALRVLKPGGYLLAFAGTRTQHRMAVRIEDAGFEIRDMIAWLYGSGFPKSRNLDAILPGFGTALKPAMEPITVARKPLAGTVESNWREWGTGALNIDGCRVAGESTRRTNTAEMGYHGGNLASEYQTGSDAGRWPANVIHDGSDEVLAAFPEAPGQLVKAATGEDRRKTQTVYGAMARGINGAEPREEDDTSAARFFYCAKASKADREEGLEALEDKLFGMSGAAAAAAARGEHYDNGDGGVNKVKIRKNNHPTVKPTALMRYLVRLVTPPGGLVLDCFAGSGSTLKAALLEGFRCIGIERDEDEEGQPLGYLEIAAARCEHAHQQYLQELAAREERDRQAMFLF